MNHTDPDIAESMLFAKVLAKCREADFNTYRDPRRIREDHGIEEVMLGGGYSYRQVLELIQNGADAVLEAHENGAASGDEHIVVRLDSNWLHVANTGAPVSGEGLEALLSSHSSPKRGNQIGRFGLGFKSLLKLDGRIFLFSKQNGNVEFNPSRCRKEISQRFNVPETEAPGLRLAWLLEKGGAPSLEQSREEQFGWAETLVSAEIGQTDMLHAELAKELAGFRSEFLLFFPVSLRIDLHDTIGKTRRLSIEKNGCRMRLEDEDKNSSWHVVGCDVRITDKQVLADATGIHGRETVPISWAFPLDAKTQAVGRFWAFFPTETDTKIAGILNAPWKLNNDRTAPIPGPWNTELMCKAAKMIADTMRDLHDPNDPGRLLDAFPRQLDSTNDFAKPLVEELWKHLADTESLADATGALRKPSELSRYPEEADANAIKDWLDMVPDEIKRLFVHPSCYHDRNRKARLDALAGKIIPNGDNPNLSALSFVEWLRKAASSDIVKAKKVLLFTRQFKNATTYGSWPRIQNDGLYKIKIIPTASGGLESANNVIIGNEVFGNRVPIARELFADDDCVRILKEVFDIPSSADKCSWDERMEQALNAALKTGDDAAWKKFWCELREAPWEYVDHFVKNKRQECCLRRRDGEWRPPCEVLIPGRWVAEDDEENTGLLIDKSEHAGERDQSLVKTLGVSDAPLDCRREYMDDMNELFEEGILESHIRWHIYKKPEKKPERKRYKRQKIEVEFPLSYKIILSLKGNGKKNAIKSLVGLMEKKNIPCSLEYHTITNRNKSNKIYHPILLLIMRSGTAPELIATDDRQLMYDITVENDNVCLTNPDIKKFLIDEIKARDLKDVLKHEYKETEITADILEKFPAFNSLPGWEKTQARHDCHIVRNLQLRIDDTYKPVPAFYWCEKQCLFIDADALEKLPTEDIHSAVLKEMKRAGWIGEGELPPLSGGTDGGNDEESPLVPVSAEVSKRRNDVKEKETLPERLLAAVENQETHLRNVLGGIGKADFTKDCTPLQIAGLFLSQFGLAALSHLRDIMQNTGLNPPSHWGTDEARQFVAEIGFPPEYAAAETARREAEAWISGPIELKPLHDFQEEVRGNLKELIQKSELRRRAVVCLPTGGGKTRVAVEAAVEFVLKPESTARSVIWIAQTDELCEQAVQAFRQVWVNNGAERTDLRICRLWGGIRTPDVQDTSLPVVVVASIQTFDRRRADEDFLSKLQKPGLLVVDECHHGITKSYTNILRWLDAEAPMPWEKQEDLATKKEPPIIGLSATPFRGDVERNKDETRRLAKRYDSRVFPQGQEQLDRDLLRKGVLARIITEEIDSGIPLTEEEESKIKYAELLYDKDMALYIGNVLEKVDERLAGIESRNQQMVDFIKTAGEQHILFFANSVAHAREMAARLTLAGIPAAPIDDKTPRTARRQFVNDFQNGKIRVLCNYRILTTGFDAPKTDMIFISRNIFSPVLYMQIVGRGLRGIKNGGTESCRIVTVRDNLGRFNDKRAYHYFREYYQDYLCPSSESPIDSSVFSQPENSEENAGASSREEIVIIQNPRIKIAINEDV